MPKTAAQEADTLQKAATEGSIRHFLAMSRIEGPGWWIGAASLSGGSLVGSIALGSGMGTGGLWVQCIAMLLGLFTLCAISQITLHSQQSLFAILKNEWNPSLALWLAACSIITSFAWCMPQFRLGAEITGSLLVPFLDNKGGKVLVALLMLVLCMTYSLIYEKRGSRSKFFHWSIKSMVLGIIVGSTFSLLAVFSQSNLPAMQILEGFIPTAKLFQDPACVFIPLLEQTGAMQSFWENIIVQKQQDLVLICLSSTLGVNLMFALPLLLLGRGWRRSHGPFAKFNLFTTAFLPFAMVSVCATLLSAIAFADGFTLPANHLNDAPRSIEEIDPEAHSLLVLRLKEEIGSNAFEEMPPFQQEKEIMSLPREDLAIASLLARSSVENWILRISSIGGGYLSYVMGATVLLIALSTIIILMVINGHLICEVMGKPHRGPVFQSGSFVLALASVGPFVWSDQGNWVSDPSYFISLAILPFALLSVLLILNNRDILGRKIPHGTLGFLLNLGTVFSTLVLGTCATYLVWHHNWGPFPVGQFLIILIGILLLIGHFSLRSKKMNQRISGLENRIQKLSETKGR